MSAHGFSQLQTVPLPPETVFNIAAAPVLFFWSRAPLEDPLAERQRLLEVDVLSSQGYPARLS